jgi:transposase
MAHVADHLSVSALEQQYRSCTDVTAARHVQTIWLLAKGHTIAEVAAAVSFARRWVERLLARYNAQGLQALGDLRRRNGTSPSVLRPDLLEKLKARLLEPPPDGGLWTSPKVAAWMAGELGLAEVLPQRGWEALKAIGWSVQKPRPAHPASATPEERAAFKKAGAGRRRGAGQAPGQTGRGLGHGRTPDRLEADPAPGVGAQRPAADCARPPPLQVALRDRLHPADLRRDLLVYIERGLQAVLRRAAGALCA